MQKPNNYDATQETSGYVPIELGGHRAVIKRVEETTSRSGKPMIKVAIDFDSNDVQPGYFMAAFKADTRDGKKWPYQAVQNILTEDAEGKCSRSFKAFISSVERSNGSTCEWGNAFEKWFTGKKVGVVYGENEEEYNGDTKTRRRIRYFCEYDKAPTQNVPEKRFLNDTAPITNAQQKAPAPTTVAGMPFMAIPDGIDDSIPF